MVNLYTARLNVQGSTCDFKVKCTCNSEVSNTDMKAFQFVKGLADVEVQDSVLTKATEGTIELANIIKIAEVIEIGKRSSEALCKVTGVQHTKRSNRNKFLKWAGGKELSGRECGICF